MAKQLLRVVELTSKVAMAQKFYSVGPVLDAANHRAKALRSGTPFSLDHQGYNLHQAYSSCLLTIQYGLYTLAMVNDVTIFLGVKERDSTFICQECRPNNRNLPKSYSSTATMCFQRLHAHYFGCSHFRSTHIIMLVLASLRHYCNTCYVGHYNST